MIPSSSRSGFSSSRYCCTCCLFSHFCSNPTVSQWKSCALPTFENADCGGKVIDPSRCLECLDQHFRGRDEIVRKAIIQPALQLEQIFDAFKELDVAVLEVLVGFAVTLGSIPTHTSSCHSHARRVGQPQLGSSEYCIRRPQGRCRPLLSTSRTSQAGAQAEPAKEAQRHGAGGLVGVVGFGVGS